jgi:hypothetical protein
VNQAVAQMDQVTQQNAALVEEAAAAAESLEEQAQGLSRTVSVFSIAGTKVAPAAAPAGRSLPLQRAQVNPGKSITRPPVKSKPSNGNNDEWNEF